MEESESRLINREAHKAMRNTRFKIKAVILRFTVDRNRDPIKATPLPLSPVFDNDNPPSVGRYTFKLISLLDARSLLNLSREGVRASIVRFSRPSPPLSMTNTHRGVACTVDTLPTYAEKRGEGISIHPDAAIQTDAMSGWCWCQTASTPSSAHFGIDIAVEYGEIGFRSRLRGFHVHRRERATWLTHLSLSLCLFHTWFPRGELL